MSMPKPPIGISKSSPSLNTFSSSILNKKKTKDKLKKPHSGTKQNLSPFKRRIVPNEEKGAASIGKPYFIIEKGVDVTPKRLLDPEYPSVSDKQYVGLPAVKPLNTRSGKLEQNVMETSSQFSLTSFTHHSRGSFTHRSRSSLAPSITSEMSSVGEMSRVSVVVPEDEEENLEMEKFTGERPPSMFRLREDRPPRNIEIKTKFTINLTETDTITFLDIPSKAHPVDSEQGKLIADENKEFMKSKEISKTVSHTATQTQSVFMVNRKLYVPRNPRENSSTWATVWDIYDTYHDEFRLFAMSGTRAEGKVEKTDGIARDDISQGDELISKVDKRLLNALMVMERLIQKERFSEKQLSFQGMLDQDPLSINVKCNYSLQLLWTFSCEITKNRKVTSMCWSSENQNILAVGYGKFKYTDKCDGLVCIWNVKNPVIPEREFYFEDPVTFVTFGTFRTQILAVTFYSGLVLLIDITTRTLTVKANNRHYPLYYPVWQARWFNIDDDNSRSQDLLTCTKNGIIYSYKKTKFFTSRNLMSMGRPHGTIQGISQPKKCYTRSTLSCRHPSAEVLVVHPSDPLLYMVGTSEGCIHLCSINHRHDYIEVFVAHNGPIYNIQFNPFCSKVFLSCGADWCIRIWAETVFEPLITLESGMAPVQDALWNPLNSTIIVSITGTSIEVWDVRRKISTPKSSTESPTKSYNTVLQFSENKYNLCVGDDAGHVHVMALTEMPFSPSFQEEVLAQSILHMLTTQPELQDKLYRLGPPFAPEDYSYKHRLTRELDRLQNRNEQ